MFSYKFKNRTKQTNQKDKKIQFILSYKKQSSSEQKIKNNSILKTPDKLNQRYKNSLNKNVKFSLKEIDKTNSNNYDKEKEKDSIKKTINSNIKDKIKENIVNSSKMNTYSANSLDINETLSQKNSLKNFQIKSNSNINRYTGSKTPNKFVKVKQKKHFYNRIDRELDNAFRIKSAEKNSIYKKKYMAYLKDELNFKQKEKLKKLKYLFFWLETKQKTIGRNNKEIFNLEKGKKINFCRSKNANKYIPSVNYNKTNLFYNKKYDLILDNLHTNKKHNQGVINEYNSKYFNRQQSSSFEKKTIDSKNRNSKESLTIRTSKTIRDEKENVSDKKSGEKQLENTIFTDNDFSPKNSKNISEKNYSSINNYYRVGKFIKKNEKRCRSSYRIKKYSNENYSKILKRGYNKLLFPLTQRLISESNLLSEQLSSERKNEKYLDRFGDEDLRKHKLKQKKNAKVDLNKIINDFELYNTKSYINETNIVLKGVKRIEKLLTNQKEINFARHVAQKVINEDILANNYFDYDATYNVRLKQISERKLFSKFAGDTALSKNMMKLQNKKKSEKDKLFKLLKGGLENFFDKKSLEFMIFKHKVANLNPGKVFD